jgi:hypothetical protein
MNFIEILATDDDYYVIDKKEYSFASLEDCDFCQISIVYEIANS